MNQSPPQYSAEKKAARVLEAAREARLHAQDWASFYRAVLGPNGIVHRVFRTQAALDEFHRSEAFREVQRMLTELRRTRPASISANEPTTMITVRVPASLHHALRAEAFDRRTTLNKLCISKLLQWIDQEMVPQETNDLQPENQEQDANQAADRPADESALKTSNTARRAQRRSA